MIILASTKVKTGFLISIPSLVTYITLVRHLNIPLFEINVQCSYEGTVASQLTINYMKNNVFCSYWPFFAKKTIFGSISITRVEKLFEKVSSLRRRVMALEQADRQIGPVIHGIYLS